jgi:hypothetical protein
MLVDFPWSDQKRRGIKGFVCVTKLLLVYADNISVFGRTVRTRKKNTEVSKNI